MNVGDLRVKLSQLDAKLLVVIPRCEDGVSSVDQLECVSVDKESFDATNNIMTDVVLLE